jgi:hypothetical protein
VSNRLDKILKLTWTVNGVAIFLLVVFSVISMIIWGIISFVYTTQRYSTVTTQTHEVTTPRAVRFSQPFAILGTKTQFVQVYSGRGYYNVEDYGSSQGLGSVMEYYDPLINVAILDADGNGRLLFEQPVLILEMNYPDPKKSSTNAIPQKWISYIVVTQDTSKNGRFGREDLIELYVSDLDGRNLQQVLSDKFKVISAEAYGTSGNELLVYALELSNDPAARDENLRETAFIFDMETGRSQSYDVLNDLMETAGRIVGR